jgi:YfiH family protein
MIQVNKNGLRYYQFELLNQHKIKHGVFTRFGGVSPFPYQSLNLGSTTGDTDKNVVINREKIFGCLDLPVNSIFDVWQVHGNEIINTTTPRKLDEPHKKADGILSNRKGITLFMRFADCVPILLFDPQKKVIGLVHAGWQGTVKRIIQFAVSRMKTDFNVNPADIIAGIGPSICPDHYEVGKNVVENASASLPEFMEKIIYNRNNSTYFDLWKTNALLLEQAGVSTIEMSGFCTAGNTAEWFSHRAEGEKSGRFAVLITLD